MRRRLVGYISHPGTPALSGVRGSAGHTGLLSQLLPDFRLQGQGCMGRPSNYAALIEDPIFWLTVTHMLLILFVGGAAIFGLGVCFQ